MLLCCDIKGAFMHEGWALCIVVHKSIIFTMLIGGADMAVHSEMLQTFFLLSDKWVNCVGTKVNRVCSYYLNLYI